jgi:HNH endonuclease
VRKISLTQGLVALVDDEDFDALDRYKWHAGRQGNVYYATRHTMKSIDKRRSPIIMHRVIMNAPSDMRVDHIDGDGPNNQRNNLRIVTRRQNGQNKHIKKSSIFPGVYWNKDHERWASRIAIDGRDKKLGYFLSESDAFRAYADALRSIGEFLLDYEISDQVIRRV